MRVVELVTGGLGRFLTRGYELIEAETGVRVTIHQSNTDTQARADHSAKNWQVVQEGLKTLVECGS